MRKYSSGTDRNLQGVCDPKDPHQKESEKLQLAYLITKTLPGAINVARINNSENWAIQNKKQLIY